MVRFSKPPLPPQPSLPSSLWCHNGNQEIGNSIGSALAGIPVTRDNSESQRLQEVVSRAGVPHPADVDPLEVSQAEVPNPDQDKKLKRLLATRVYSKRYHSKQLKHIANLETEVKVRETEIAVTYPRIRFSRRTNMLLRAQNDLLKQKISQCSGKLIVKQVEHEDLQKELEWYRNLYQMQQAVAAVNPLAESGYMAFNSPAQFGHQAFDPDFEPSYQPFNPPAQFGHQAFDPDHFEPSYQPFNPLAGLDSETVDFGQFYAPAEADQFNIELPVLDDQFRSDPVELYQQLDEPVGFFEFTDELAAVVKPHIMADKGADDQPTEGMNLDNSDDSQKASGSSS